MGEHEDTKVVPKQVVKLPTADSFGLTKEKKELLSEIIAEINSRTGKAYDNDVAVKAMLQIRDILLKSDKLKASAKNNTMKDFEFSYFDDIDDALKKVWARTRTSSRCSYPTTRSSVRSSVYSRKRYIKAYGRHSRF